MVKGVNKLIVEVSNPDSEYFEKAIFFVKPQMKDTPTKQLNKSADELISAAVPRRRRGGVHIGFIFAGAAGFGAIVAAVLIMLVT
ncbi:MAG: hypothetical protein FWF94_01685 [Oscillospiraceae bacterium]|nr:hypothetical protein [Oscillospiraceae bacterium]